jgi:dihydrofolate reductase
MISIIVATSENGIIGKDGSLPWRKQKADMGMFRRTTIGHPVIMGRKTYESIPFDLDDRHQIVMTKSRVIGHGQSFCGFGNTSIASSIEEAIEIADSHSSDVFVIGGSEVYELFLPIADRIIRTMIHAEIEGDASFAVPEDWELIEEKRHSSDIDNEHDYTYQLYERASRL